MSLSDFIVSVTVGAVTALIISFLVNRQGRRIGILRAEVDLLRFDFDLFVTQRPTISYPVELTDDVRSERLAEWAELDRRFREIRAEINPDSQHDPGS